ncbi:MAG: AAA-like domain-containing protein [Crocosphaera sp.]
MNIEFNPPYDYKVGGSLSPDHPTYIERKADNELYKAASKGEFCSILNSRQMGKSSLMIRTLKRLENDGFRCVFIDISIIGEKNSSSDEWYFGLIKELNNEFNNSDDINSWWISHKYLSPRERFKTFIYYLILKIQKESIIICFDEIDSIIKFKFKDDFFSLLRGFYQLRSLESVYNRLNFIISGVASPYDLMSNNAQTPFNIGKAIELKGFTLQETKPLWEGLKDKVDDPEAVMTEILAWTGGQPFLTQKICKLIKQDSNRIRSESEKHYINYLIQWSIIEHWESKDEPQHLRTIYKRLKYIHRNHNFFSKYDKNTLLNGLSDYHVDKKLKLELRLSGFMIQKNGKLKVYNKIYAEVFENVLIEFSQDQQTDIVNSSFNLMFVRNIIQKITDKQLTKTPKNIQIMIGMSAVILIIPLFLNFDKIQSLRITLFPKQHTESPISTIPLPERFSRGDIRLFKNKKNPSADLGIIDFKEDKYEEADQHFTQAISSVPYDPEIQIYLNNSQARKAGKPFTLAVVVPVDQRSTNAEEMLRGVAQAQTQFNQQGINGRLLEIMIINDSNDKKYAQEVAKEIVNKKDILGVIGHNSSGASAKGLKEYKKAGIAMISPTSTSTTLSGNVFFRTVPSDAKAGQFLAAYAAKNNMTKVAVFYTSTSNYSQSLREAFIDYFKAFGTTELYDMSITDFNPKSIVESLKNQVDCFVLFPNTDNKIINLSFQVADANANLSNPKKLLGGDVLYNPATLKSNRPGVVGLVLAVPWFAQPTYPYTNLAAKRWGGRVSWRTATSYDATKAFIKALSENATRNSVLINLQRTNLSTSETSGEPLQFLKSGDRNTDPLLVRVIPRSSNFAEYDFEIIED